MTNPFRHVYCVLLIFFSLTACASPVPSPASCADHALALQVLGSGGPEMSDKRASSGYVIWRGGKARLLVDMGGGSMLRFEQSGARVNDLDRILLTHLHVDHSVDLPYLIKASFFSGRDRDLPVYGPTGNFLMPSMSEFTQDLFGKSGAFRYLSDYLDGTESYRLIPHDVATEPHQPMRVVQDSDVTVTAIPVHHGPIPALAWRVEVDGRSVVFSGDMNNDYHTLASLAQGADLLVAHHAIPERAGSVARSLHMPPSVIGVIAGKARVRQLLLSHRMQRTFGHEQQSLTFIREHYQGPVQFAEDLQCMVLIP